MTEKSRYWLLTAHIENMKKAGLTDEQIQDYQLLAKFFLDKWESSSPTRTGCITVCISANGVFHLHGALYGEKTTRTSVAKLMFDSHIEPCKGGKTNLLKYVLKEPPYDESGERILFVEGKNNIQIKQGKRSDMDIIEEMLVDGCTPCEIMENNFGYRRYERMIKSAFADKKLREAPIRKQIYREWHVGESGTGKSYCYEKLCNIYGADEIYFSGYMTTGWLDRYMEDGAPSILFIDELKPFGSWQELLNVLDVYTQRPIHSRYQDIYPLWTQVIITSVYPPEEIYEQMVKPENRRNDSFEQLLRRLDTIVYHYIEDGKYKEFRMSASSYINYEDLKRQAGGKLK